MSLLGKYRPAKTKTTNKRKVTHTTKIKWPWGMYVEEVQNPAGEILFMVSNEADFSTERERGEFCAGLLQGCLFFLEADANYFHGSRQGDGPSVDDGMA